MFCDKKRTFCVKVCEKHKDEILCDILAFSTFTRFLNKCETFVEDFLFFSLQMHSPLHRWTTFCFIPQTQTERQTLEGIWVELRCVDTV